MADITKDKTENNEIEEIADAVEETVEETAETAEEIAESLDDDDEETVKEQDEEAEKKESKIVDDILEIIESTLLAVFVIVMIFTYLLHPVKGVGGSMNDTLVNGNRIFMTTVYTGPHYGDIIVINNDMAYLLDQSGNVIDKDITGSDLKECIIKRVIAEPGQTLDIDAEKE